MHPVTQLFPSADGACIGKMLIFGLCNCPIRAMPEFCKRSGKISFLPMFCRRSPGAVCLAGACRHQRGTTMTDKLIDVYMGFMDEEVNTVLASLIKRELDKTDASTRRPVILIERNTVAPDGPILEWPLSRYPASVSRVLYANAGTVDSRTPPSSDKPTAEDPSPEGILRQAIAVFLESDDAAEKALREASVTVLRMFDAQTMQSLKSGASLKVPLDKGGPAFSIVRFAVGDDAQGLAPIIVFRVPEMGLQPNLMSPYLEFVLMMISALSSQLAYRAKESDEWPLRLICFGAQGGASTGKDPGSVALICASLYVGYEFLNGVRTPSIALCSQGGIYRFNAGEKLQTDDLETYFNAHYAALVVDSIERDDAYLRKEEADITKGMPIKDVIRRLVTNYAGTSKATPEISGTSNWFISAAQKEAFAAIGITGCNMEDYWVLRSMRRCALERVKVEPRERSMYPVFDRGFLTRANADPLRIEPDVARAFQTDVSTKKLSRQDYASLLLWGLQGVPLKGDGEAGMPAVARWKFADAPVFSQGNTFAKHLYGFLVPGGEEVIVPDPFFSEIATDLLKSCKASLDAKARSGTVGNEVFAASPGNEVIEALGVAAGAVFARWNEAGQKPTPAVREALAAFVNTLADRAGFATADGVKVWLRPGKWQNIRANSIQDLPRETVFTDAAVDRAFYKSSNLIALQENTARVLR
jgi:hypothetical protein